MRPFLVSVPSVSPHISTLRTGSSWGSAESGSKSRRKTTPVASWMPDTAPHCASCTSSTPSLLPTPLMALLLRSIAPDFRSYYDPAKALEPGPRGLRNSNQKQTFSTYRRRLQLVRHHPRAFTADLVAP